MMIYMIALTALLPLVSALADDVTARERLIGVWQQQDDSGKGVSTWVMEAKGNLLHITNSQGDQILSEISCDPTGAECDGTVSGKKAKVVMYYNGPTLVELETIGSDVVKRRFTVAEQPDLMEIEVMAITGNTKSETLHLKRMPSTADH